MPGFFLVMIFWYEDKNGGIKSSLDYLYENLTANLSLRNKKSKDEYFLIQYWGVYQGDIYKNFFPNIFTEEYNEKLLKLQKEGVTLIIDSSLEGTIYRKDLYNYIKNLKSTGIDISKVILATNNLTPPTDYFGLKVKIICFPRFLITTLFKCKPYINNSDIKPSFKFLCLNRRMRLYKYKLMLELSRKQLLKDTLYSWITSVEGRYPEIGSLKKKGIENDIFLSRDDKLNDELGLYGFNSDWYKLVKLDIVNETYYSEKNEIHITEKVFKPIMLGIPFVVNSTKNYIKNLNELGFTYPDIDYDSSDDDNRYKNVVETAEYLLDKNLNEYTSYNRELFHNLDHKKSILEKLFFSKINVV